MMHNDDLIAFLKPIENQFGGKDRVELLDLTGQVWDIQSSRHRLCLRLELPAGLYRGFLRTVRHAFDMSTASIAMIRVPDGARVPLGPWDLDHLHNVMAMPMARVWVNGALKGGLWFAMPGPEEIAAGRLCADFGFEAGEGTTEVVLELVERDRERMGWDRLESLELRLDDRRTAPLLPRSAAMPRLFASAQELAEASKRWEGSPRMAALRDQLRREELVLLTDNSQGTLSLACVVYSLTGDAEIGARARDAIMKLAHAPTWSGRPDPLLMGGENDRGISLRLFHVALAWDHLQPLLSEEDRRALLAKADEYLRKMYDFTVLQRAYMGYPAIDPHSLGSWNGPAIACMAFYEELAIARHALPFFHGLLCDSLSLYPASGKAAWATYFPFHLVLYLAAAQTFAGPQAELQSSAFLDHLGEALLACFEAPNSQELQRGLRTREHRFLTAYLCRFHATPGIESIYRAFAVREEKTAGDLTLGIFDLLYAPEIEGPVAAFPSRPLFAADVGDIIAVAHGTPSVAVSVSGGAKAGRRASFLLMPQNREFAPSLGAFEMAVDGAPVLCNINISSYGLNSALTNAMCLEDGGVVTNGQYLNGAVRPEQSCLVRRCLLGERFVYAQMMVTGALDPALAVRRAERIFVFDRRTGSVVFSDAFAAERPLRFATHLHCSGSATALADGSYRLTGGQANLIAGMKRGGKGLDDAERGEVFVRVLQAPESATVEVEEPQWIPGYIYGLNYTGDEELSDGRFPRYRRWRLKAEGPQREGTFLVAVTPVADAVLASSAGVLLPEGGFSLGPGRRRAMGVTAECECLLWDEREQRVMAMGCTMLEHMGAEIRFPVSADVEYAVASQQGVAYASSSRPPEYNGFLMEVWQPAGAESWRSHAPLRASFKQQSR